MPINNTIARLQNTLKANPSCERTQRLLKRAIIIRDNIIAKQSNNV